MGLMVGKTYKRDHEGTMLLIDAPALDSIGMRLDLAPKTLYELDVSKNATMTTLNHRQNGFRTTPMQNESNK